MKQRKSMWKSFAFFDRTGVVHFLEREAEKGWILEDTSGLRWTFRRGEPRSAHVWVTYLRQDTLDPEPTQEVKDMAELGEHTGWQLIVSTPFLQVFYNWHSDPIPMETDPVTEVEGMHRMFKRNVLRGSWMWFGGLPLVLLLILMFLRESPLDVLSSYHLTYFMFMDVLIWVTVGAELAGYYLWLAGARRNAQRGELADAHGWSVASRAVSGFVVVTLLVWVWTNLAGNHNSGFLGKNLLFQVLCIMGLGGMIWMRNAMRRRKVARQKTELAMAAGFCILFFALFGGAGWLSVHVGWFPAETADSWWSQFPGGMPLTVEQLRGEVGDETFWVRRDGEESLLLGRYQGWQVSEKETGPEEDMNSVLYTVVLVKLPVLYDLCRDNMLWQDHEKMDPAPWLAREAYQERKEGRLHTYLLCYDTCLVQISFGWEPTQEQMQLVGEAFGGIYNE